MKKFALILALCLVFSLMAGCSDNGGNSGNTPAVTNPGQTTEPVGTTEGNLIEDILNDLLTQTYTLECGASITAPVGMTEAQMDGFTGALDSPTIAMLLLEENKASFPGYSLADYGDLIVSINSLENAFDTDAWGNTCTVYEAIASDGNKWTYYLTIHETASSFWMCHFACKSDQYELYQEGFGQWSATLTLPEGEAPVVSGDSDDVVYDLGGGYSITACAGLSPMELAGYHAYYANNDVGFAMLVESKADGSLADYTLEDYCAALIEVNGYDPFEKNAYGLYETEHTYSSATSSFWYYTTVHETEDAFIMLQFFTFTENEAELRPSFEQWSATLTYNAG